ncbi:MAG TPA: serine hydrolase domain-containing protein [Anaerolineae bacterium]|nr:serine hydrolase domain-containing protein [Anaerolineae bacterium]
MLDSDLLSNFIQSELQSANIPGCSLVIVDRSDIISSGAFGYADIQQRRLATPKTAYHLFSGTKLYTATAVMQLVEAGKLTLDDPLSKYITGLGRAENITIKQLLSHTSGLNDTLKAFLAVHFEDEAPITTTEALNRYQISLKREPGAKVEYGNANYALLGEIITRVAGQPYTSYVTEHILKPLKMPVAFTLTEEMKVDAATGYMRRWEPMRLFLRLMMPGISKKLYAGHINGFVALRNYDLDTAAIGGLVGSVMGFAPFVMAHLNTGAGILIKDSGQLMQTMVARGQAGIASKVGIGLGWKFGQTGEEVFINHEGGGAGFTSETRIYPARGIGLVIAMNRMSMPQTSMVAHRICEKIVSELTH